MPDATHLLATHQRGVPPIIHSGFTESEYKKAKATAEKEARACIAFLSCLRDCYLHSDPLKLYIQTTWGVVGMT